MSDIDGFIFRPAKEIIKEADGKGVCCLVRMSIPSKPNMGHHYRFCKLCYFGNDKKRYYWGSMRAGESLAPVENGSWMVTHAAYHPENITTGE